MHMLLLLTYRLFFFKNLLSKFKHDFLTFLYIGILFLFFLLNLLIDFLIMIFPPFGVGEVGGGKNRGVEEDFLT